MPTRPRTPSPQPTGAPRWVAMFYEPSSSSWKAGAQSPYRSPVLYAVGEMTQTLRARGEDPAVELWGPGGDPGGGGDGDGHWERYDPAVLTADAVPPRPSDRAAAPAAKPSTLAERMTGRRQQVLMAGLGKAGLYDLAPDDVAAVRAVVDGLDETTVRRVAHWLTVASTGRP
ncbi:hypothetical protein [Streptomyces sp. HM190]|uniref:hypothetical protein n=1 Tax=Streptomyces sp. HM190 TaxID=2695266 RepID=UPI00135C232B|nr:hypothetical protein [Streptomyces sp. HM190]